ncbi:MAG: hypothetical protein J6S14_15750 [Clostridia bacterium]|nr:hypothetical protein [Clostridia bacterium]
MFKMIEYADTFEPVPEFIIVGDKFDVVKDSGYKLDFTADRTHRNFTKALFWDGTIEAENRAGDKIDGFYDLITAMLCKTEDGTLYAVEYLPGKTGDTPCIWQRVISAE